VISQVDCKFILVKLHVPSQELRNGRAMLVLIDQHAADERIRVEGLLAELFYPPTKDLPVESRILTNPLKQPLVFEVSHKEAEILQRHVLHFRNWGILYDLPHWATSMTRTIPRLTVRYLPPGIIERCQVEPRLLIDLIRIEAWKANENAWADTPQVLEGSWLERLHTCPQGILDMLNSRACRSAIMFNDNLSKEQCQVLIRKLILCKFPFQCAHGRPSLVPLVDMGSLESLRDFSVADNLSGFESKFAEWKGNMC